MALRGFVHIHSNVQDGQLSIPELAELHRQRGYDFISITDHLDGMTKTSYVEYSALCESLSDERFLCLYGFEGATRSGPHLMAICPGEFVPIGELDFHASAEAVQRAGGIAVLAHPTRQEVAQTRDAPLDGIEVWNGIRDGWGPNSALLRSLLAMQEAGRSIVGFGGPDAHAASHLFKVETVLETERATALSVLDCLRSGRFSLRRGPVKIAALGSKPTVTNWGVSASHMVYATSLRSGKVLWTRLGLPIPETVRRFLERTR